MDVSVILIICGVIFLIACIWAVVAVISIRSFNKFTDDMTQDVRRGLRGTGRDK
jgi:hypothetical protein